MSFTYNGIVWGVHSEVTGHSFAYSSKHPNLLRFEVREDDEWPGDEGRSSEYNRSELGAFQQGIIEGGNEVWFSWAVLGWGIREAASIFQIYSDQVELQLQSSVAGLQVHTWTSGSGEQDTHDVRYTDAPMNDGRAEQFVLRLRSRATGDAELQLWRNGVQRCNLSGFSMGVDNPTNQKRPKIGIYRPKRATTTVVHIANFTHGADLSGKVADPDPLPSWWRR